MSNARANWVALVKECDSCGLPVPTMFPAKLGEKFEVKVGDRFRMFDESPDKAICACLDFVSGYRARMEDEKQGEKNLMYATLYGAQSSKAGAYNVD